MDDSIESAQPITIESLLEPITGYLKKMERDTVKGWYYLEIGIPNNWVFDENNDISCEILNENDFGKYLKISPKKNNIIVDDLVSFVEIIIQTNEQIVEKEKQFTSEMENWKIAFEEKAKQFYKELDELKENSFKTLNDNFVKKLRANSESKRKPRQKKQVASNDISDSEKNTNTE